MRRLTNAEMSEWFKEHDWKSCDAGTYPEVQILFSAPKNTFPFGKVFLREKRLKKLRFLGGSREEREKAKRDKQRLFASDDTLP